LLSTPKSENKDSGFSLVSAFTFFLYLVKVLYLTEEVVKKVIGIISAYK
jgi:hypothetical protein